MTNMNGSHCVGWQLDCDEVAPRHVSVQLATFPSTSIFGASTWNSMSRSKISTWIRFDVPEPHKLDAKQLVKPLREFDRGLDRGISSCYLGAIIESPLEYLLIITWHTPEVFQSFEGSPFQEEMLAVINSFSDKVPETTIIDFGPCHWVRGLNASTYTGMKDVYFPESMSQETREAVDQIRALYSRISFGSGSPQNYLTTSGFKRWVEGLQTFEGEKAWAILFCHPWTSQEREQKFNSHEGFRTMATLDKQLRELKPLGWQEFHVDLQNWTKIGSSADDEEDEEEEGEEE